MGLTRLIKSTLMESMSPDKPSLTAKEAAARLGVKRATLYAYVSRGLLHRSLADDGRASRFDADEIEAFRAGRRRRAEGELDAVVSTALTSVRDGELRIRGKDLVALVLAGADFEAVVDCLWGVSPTGAWAHARTLQKVIASVQKRLPSACTSLDRLRVTVSVASAADPLRFDLSATAVHTAGRALLSAMVDGLPLQGRVNDNATRIQDRLWPRLTTRRTNTERRGALNAALALLVDHGMATSTLGARVAASVRADPYSVVLAGLGVVGGALHGAASTAVHELFSDAETASDASDAVGRALRRTGTAPGHGHAVYRSADPRYLALSRLLDQAWSNDPRLSITHAVRDVIASRTEAVPNIDLALGALTFLAGMPANSGEAIFAIARTAGWLAHAIEEYSEAPLRFRPRARYRGRQSIRSTSTERLT